MLIYALTDWTLTVCLRLCNKRIIAYIERTLVSPKGVRLIQASLYVEIRALSQDNLRQLTLTWPTLSLSVLDPQEAFYEPTLDFLVASHETRKRALHGRKGKKCYWLQWIFFSPRPNTNVSRLGLDIALWWLEIWASIEPLSDYSFRKDKKEKNTVNTDFTQKLELLTTFNVRVIITNSPTFLISVWTLLSQLSQSIHC